MGTRLERLAQAMFGAKIEGAAVGITPGEKPGTHKLLIKRGEFDVVAVERPDTIHTMGGTWRGLDIKIGSTVSIRTKKFEAVK